MAISSCTTTEEDALTVTFEPITEALAPERIDTLIRAALTEDVGAGDVTSDALVPMDMTCRGKIVCKQDGVIAGLSIAQRVFNIVDPRIQFDAKTKDGEKVQVEQIVARLYGPARGILRAERVGLNFLQHLSGVATTTARIVKAVDGTKTQILDTRKTTPGLRALEKYATRMGGAVNHRMGLFDAVLIKDTHLALVGGISTALRSARKAHPEIEINVEVSNLQELEAALAEKAPRILLDNFSCGQVREAMQIIRGRAIVEVSGGVTAANARAYALAGADYISIGALTHSATARGPSPPLPGNRGGATPRCATRSVRSGLSR
jgi:nicotinate-nucleotide pyrophosphorylase (carboxylating)